MDPVITTNTIVQLTSEQILGMMQERILGLFFSMILLVIGGLFGSRVRGEIGKIFGIIFGLLGAIGTIGFMISLLNLSTQMIS